MLQYELNYSVPTSFTQIPPFWSHEHIAHLHSPWIGSRRYDVYILPIAQSLKEPLALQKNQPDRLQIVHKILKILIRTYPKQLYNTSPFHNLISYHHLVRVTFTYIYQQKHSHLHHINYTCINNSTHPVIYLVSTLNTGSITPRWIILSLYWSSPNPRLKSIFTKNISKNQNIPSTHNFNCIFPKLNYIIYYLFMSHTSTSKLTILTKVNNAI